MITGAEAEAKHNLINDTIRPLHQPRSASTTKHALERKTAAEGNDLDRCQEIETIRRPVQSYLHPHMIPISSASFPISRWNAFQSHFGGRNSVGYCMYSVRARG